MQTEQLDLETVKSRLEEWRTDRPKQGKIPDAIWRDVLSLIGQYDTATINKTLGITNQQIKAKMDSLVNAELEQIKKAQFTKVVSAQSEKPTPSKTNVVALQPKAATLTHDVEITRKDGAILKVKAVQHADVQSIILAFLS